MKQKVVLLMILPNLLPQWTPSWYSVFLGRIGEHDYIAFDEYYNEPIGRSFGNCDIYNTTITWLRRHDHMARYFPIFLVFGAKFQYFDNGE